MKLLSVSADAKTVKGEGLGYLTGITYLAPANISGYEVCPNRTAGCTEVCLNSAGRGAFSNVKKSRISKTLFYFQNRVNFMKQLVKEIEALIRKAERMRLIPVIRLNGTSDIPWERISVSNRKNIMEMFPGVQFYDYTKRANRTNLPKNYHLTFSLAEDNEKNALTALDNGMNVAVVFRTNKFPTKYFGKSVINGDDSDLRFLDGHSNIIALKAKGKAKKDMSGFVREVA